MRSLLPLLATLAACAPEADGTCDIPGVICTIAGTAYSGFNGDGLTATATQLYYPTAVAFDPEGRLLLDDFNNNRVRLVGDDDLVATVVGSGVHGWATEGLPARETALENPVDVAYGPDGTLYVAELHTHRILAIVDGRVRIVAGNGGRGYRGDGGPATVASLSDPTGIDVDEDGQIWIADTGHDVVRVVRANGVIETVIGDGKAGLVDDAGLPRLSSPQHIDLADGRLLVADTGNSAVRALDIATGVVTTLADEEDGLVAPTGVVGGPDGEVYVADFEAEFVGRIDPDGTFSRVIGDGVGLHEGDGGPAGAARVKQPIDVTLDPDGALIVVEMGASAIRRVAP